MFQIYGEKSVDFTGFSGKLKISRAQEDLGILGYIFRQLWFRGCFHWVFREFRSLVFQGFVELFWVAIVI